MKRFPFRSLPVASLFLAVAGGAASQEKPAAPAVDFVKDIQPILEFNCVSCHNADEAKAGLRFDRHDLFLKGGDGGASFVAGKPDESLLIELVSLPKDDSDVIERRLRLDAVDDYLPVAHAAVQEVASTLAGAGVR